MMYVQFFGEYWMGLSYPFSSHFNSDRQVPSYALHELTSLTSLRTLQYSEVTHVMLHVG